MDIREILKKAIAIEKRAVQRYVHLADLMIDKKQILLCKALENMERGHVVFFTELFDNPDLSRLGNLDIVTEKKETYSYVFKGAQSTAKDLLLFAINEEESAAQYYLSIRDKFSKESKERPIFDKLAREEFGHKRALQRLYRKMFQEDGK